MAAQPTQRLYIGNLPTHSTVLDVYNICAPLGKVSVVELIYAAAFVDFADPTVVEKAITELDGEYKRS